MYDHGNGDMGMHNGSFYGIHMFWWALVTLFLFAMIIWGIRAGKKK